MAILRSIFAFFAPPTVFFDLAYLANGVPTTVVTGKQRLTTFWLSNNGAAMAKVTITRTSGVPYATNMELSPETVAPFLDREFMYVDGLVITPNSADITCQTEGYAHVS